MQITTFDASAVLQDLSESLRAEALRNLFKVEGPRRYRSVRRRNKRIVQNLVLNALEATDARRPLVWQGALPRWILTVGHGSGLRGTHPSSGYA